MTVLLALVAPDLAGAAPRIALGAIQGEFGRGVSRQLASTLCDTYECVPRSQVTTKGKLDLGKMGDQEVAGFVFGSVTSRGGRPRLWLALVLASRPSRTWTLSLTAAGTLPGDSLEQIARQVGEEIRATAPPGAPALAAASPVTSPEGLPRPRIALGAVRGKGERVSRQLAAALCSVYRCVSRHRVTTRGEADLDKMNERGVDGLLSGVVTVQGGRSSLRLDLVTTPPLPSRTWSFPLTGRGTLAPGSVDQLMRDLETEFAEPAPSAAAPPPLGAAPPLPPVAAPPSPPAGPEARSPELPAPAPALATRKVPPARAPAAARREGRPTQWLVGVEAGTFLASRTLGYGAAPGPTPLLRGYQGSIAGPYLFAEVFPVSPFTDQALLSGIGLFARYAFSLGLETMANSQRYPSGFLALDAGLEWRLRPFSSSGFALVPAASYRLQRFTVEPPFPGLPDSNLSGVTGSLRIEVPLGEAFTLLLGGSYTRWLSARDLIGDGYFPAGSAYALEAEAGVGLAIFGPLSLRVLGFYDTTRYALEAGPRPLYRATSASDSQIGGRATVRARF